MVTRILVIVAVSVLGVQAVAGRAVACSFPPCFGPMFFPARGSVPANLPAVLFWPAVSYDDADGGRTTEVRFVRLDAAGPQEVPFTLEPSDLVPPYGMWRTDSRGQGYRIVPREPLQDGARYALWSRDCGGAIATDPPRNPQFETYDFSAMLSSSFAVFDVTAAAPVPAGLGAVTLSSPVRESVTYGGGSTCSFRCRCHDDHG